MKRMTMSEFYNVMTRLRRAGWKAFVTRGQQIRLRNQCSKGRCHCPISAAILHVSGTEVHIGCIEDEAHRIGLPICEADRIKMASDHPGESQITRRRIASALRISRKVTAADKKYFGG